MIWERKKEKKRILVLIDSTMTFCVEDNGKTSVTGELSFHDENIDALPHHPC
jgi:hypothetical protein